MDRALQVGTAVAGGYLLGRTKKLRLVALVGGVLLGRQLVSNPGVLMERGSRLVQGNEELSRLADQARDKVVTAAREGMVAAATKRLDSLSDGLRDRTEKLRETADATPEAAEPDDDAEESEAEESEAEESEAEESEAPRRRTRSGSGGRRTATRSRSGTSRSRG